MTDRFFRPNFNFVSTNLVNRKIQKLPYKVLDAPQLTANFYYNILDWSSQNQVAIALEN